MSIYRRAFSKEDRRLVIISTYSFEFRMRVPDQDVRWMRTLPRDGDVLFREQLQRGFQNDTVSDSA